MRKLFVRLTGVSAMATALTVGPAALAQGVGLGVTPASPAGETAVPASVGAWMICAASYTGPQARELADELASEIRARYRMPAYIFNRSAQEKKAEHERVARIREAQKQKLREAGLPEDTPLRIKTIRIEDQYAVLVGGYPDDAAARKALDEIRKLKPSDKLQHVAYVPDASGKMAEKSISPFQSAFVCRNPSVPVEKPSADKANDPRLKDYNADESFSLLKCPKACTLVVKSYAGASVVQAQTTPSTVMEKLGLGKKAGDLLNANAKQAHHLAEFLRKFGFEAYVLHTEYNSYVTIGGFEGPEDPKLVQMQRAFVNEMANPNSNIGQLHTKGMVQFLAQPMPMMVPAVK